MRQQRSLKSWGCQFRSDSLGMCEGGELPYLQVDLDAMHKFPTAAAGCSIPEAQVYKGMLKLWESRWRESTGFVSLLFLECIFEMPGRGERCAQVLCELGFLEVRESGHWVCGSEKYLRIKEARSKGGKRAAANGNLKRGASGIEKAKNGPKRGKSPSLSWEAAGEQLESTPSSAPALTPITEHHSPNKKLKSIAPAVAAPTRLKQLEKALVSDYAAMRPGAKYLHGGAKDTEALKRIEASGHDFDDVRGRWRYGLRQSGWLGINTLAQLGQKFNDLAGYFLPLPEPDTPRRVPKPEDMNGAAEAMAMEIPF